MTARTADQRQADRDVVARVRAFRGHIEDMSRDEMVYLLGYLASAVERLLGDDPDAGRCPGPGGCFPDEPCQYRSDDCAAR